MILEQQKEALIHQEGESQESIGMSLDLDSAQILMQMLSKNLYSDDIGSTVRECASNALDSHRRAGTDKPIIVSLGKNDQDNYEFSVEDFGIGLDADDVKNIISKYGKSTKRNSANELGMMGLGFKAPLAYTSTFYFICRKNGVERKYMMYEGEDVNTIDLLYENATDQPNGVKVIIPVEYYDYSNFIKKIREQLAYFENVYFNVPGIDNNFNIIRTEHFQISPLSDNRFMHLCLDNVYYPLDYQKLGITNVNLPIAIRFSLSDGIFPTPNREAIRYTQEAKDIILKKLENLGNYFVEKYNETVEDTDDFKQIYDFHTSNKRMVQIGTERWDVHELCQFATVPMNSPKMKDIKMLDLKRMIRNQEYILGEYFPKYIATSRSVRDAKHSYGLNHPNRLKNRNYYYESDRIPGIKKDYIRSFSKNSWDELPIFKKTNFPLFKKGGAYDNYYTILDLKNHPKEHWRQIITEFQAVVKGLSKDFINIDTLEVPEEFIEARKKSSKSAVVITGGTKVRRVKLKGEFVCKKAEEFERYVDGKNCKWVSNTYDMATFHRKSDVYVYGRQCDAEKMDEWYSASRKSNVKFIILSERELKVLEKIELHNLMSFSKFMEGKSKAFRRIATACLIDEFYDQNKSTFTNSVHLEGISKDLYEKIEKLDKYRSDYLDHSMTNRTRTAIVNHATEINGFDPDIIDDFKAVKEISEKLPFLDVILSKLYRRIVDTQEEKKLLQALVDLFKYHKHRIDWKNYKIVMNDDVVTEELTSEVVEELVD